jgi:hypothetical protein
MISALVACALGMLILAFGLLAGAAAGISSIEGNLLKEGFYIDREPQAEIGHGHLELWRRNAEGKWVQIKNVG